MCTAILSVCSSVRPSDWHNNNNDICNALNSPKPHILVSKRINIISAELSISRLCKPHVISGFAPHGGKLTVGVCYMKYINVSNAWIAAAALQSGRREMWCSRHNSLVTRNKQRNNNRRRALSVDVECASLVSPGSASQRERERETVVLASNQSSRPLLSRLPARPVVANPTILISEMGNASILCQRSPFIAQCLVADSPKASKAVETTEASLSITFCSLLSTGLKAGRRAGHSVLSIHPFISFTTLMRGSLLPSYSSHGHWPIYTS